jgi:hypothetical protein
LAIQPSAPLFSSSQAAATTLKRMMAAMAELCCSATASKRCRGPRRDLLDIDDTDNRITAASSYRCGTRITTAVAFYGSTSTRRLEGRLRRSAPRQDGRGRGGAVLRQVISVSSTSTKPASALRFGGTML